MDAPAPFVIEPADPRSPDAADLIHRLTVELRTRYDDLDDGTGNFSPDDVRCHRSAFLLGRVGPLAVACGAFRPLDAFAAAELKRIYVAPAHRGRGYATLLLADLERRARACGYARLLLETGDRQPESIALYERAGFHRIPNFGPYADSHWSVCFEKHIASTP